MLSDEEVSAAIGSTAYGPDGDAIGTVEQFFVDDRTGDPTWVAVTTGLFGTRQSILPAVQATFTDGGLRVPVDREAVRTAPVVEATEHLGPAEEAELRRHYGLAEHESLTERESLAEHGRTTGTGDDAPPAGTDRAAAPATDGAMTRSEERLRVFTQPVATTRVRVVKYVVTEQIQVTVPLRREEIRIEEIPLDTADAGAGQSLDAGDAPAGTAPGGLPEEIILHKEEPVVTVRVVPAERVRLRVETTEAQQQVSAPLQREEIVVDEQPVGRSTES